jgi:hypothetical protein
MIVVVILAVSGGVVLVGSHRGDPHGGPAKEGQPSSEVTRHPADHDTKTPTSLAPKSTSEVPRTATQQRIDSALAQAETPAGIAAALRETVPAPDTSTAYPSVRSSDRSDPAAYATAFATELLDTNFTVQSRGALLVWAEHVEAPNTLPGVPANVAGKALVLSLADPDLPGGSPSPVPSASLWLADAQRGVRQSVTDVQAEVDPDWTELISQGWQPRDPLMIVETVTGTMTVVVRGVPAQPESFSLTLTLGSGAFVQAGYGAVAASNWVLA